MKQQRVVGNLQAQKTEILAAGFSPDGLKVAVSYNDGTIRIWQKNNEAKQFEGTVGGTHKPTK